MLLTSPDSSKPFPAVVIASWATQFCDQHHLRFLGGESKLALGLSGFILVSMIIVISFSWWRRLLPPRPLGLRLVHAQITFVGDAVMPAISPDGKFLAYVMRESESKQKLMMQTLAGGPSLELLRAHRLLNPRWSPDGSELMVQVRERDVTKRGIYVISRLGGTPRPMGVGFAYFAGRLMDCTWWAPAKTPKQESGW
jgi:hypothetical protein